MVANGTPNVNRPPGHRARHAGTLARVTDPGRSLTPYDDPLLYRMLHDEWSGDVPFYASLAERALGPSGASESSGATLECGIGTGRLAIALARLGHVVHGVDREPGMLATLADRLDAEAPDVRARVSFERADVATMRLGRSFSLVLVPYNGIAHQLDDEALAAFLAGVRAHLAPGGLLAFDVWVPSARTLAGTVSDSPRFVHPRTGQPARCEERTSFDASTGVVSVDLTVTHVGWAPGPSTDVLSLRLRHVPTERLATLLHENGFRVLHRSTSFAPWDGTTAADVAQDRELHAWVCTHA